MLILNSIMKGCVKTMIEILQDGNAKPIDTSKDKALSSLCKYLVSSAKSDFITVNDIASAIGVTPQSYRNKMTRNSFSINDLLIICDMVGATLQVHTKQNSTITLELSDFLDSVTYDNYMKYKNESKQIVFSEILEMTKGLTEEEMQALIDARKADLSDSNK